VAAPTQPQPGSVDRPARSRHRAAFTPLSVGPGAVRKMLEQTLWAESIGYEDVWLADAGGVDALTLAALLLDRTERMRVGIAVSPVYTRTPAVFAASVATLADIGPGRFALGLGSGSETMINGWHGLQLRKPVAHVRETVTLLRQMLAGEKTSFEGQALRSEGYRQPALDADVPIFLAALRPRMIELAAAIADGIILNLFPLQSLPRIMETIHSDLALAGREPGSLEIGTRLQAMVTDDVETARTLFRRLFGPYFTNPVYNAFLAWAGYETEAAEILDAGSVGDWRRVRAALTDELVDGIAVIGAAEQCQERLLALAEGGIQTPMLFCLSDDPDVQRDTYAALSPAEMSGK
jgi:probable F420-dependent oxidoreductase